jgi:hypothetical protein
MRRIPILKLNSTLILSVACLLAAGFAQQQSGAQANKSEPWTPPDLGASPKPAATSTGSIDASKLPDIIGVHLGMDPKEALSVVRAHYPKSLLTTYDTNMYTFPASVYQGTIVNPASNYADDFSFIATLPPEKQAVWRVNRVTKAMHVSRDTLFAALRAKYGKETVAIANNSYDAARSDAEAANLLWLFDESGKQVPLPNSGLAAVMACWNVPDHPGTHYLLDEATGKPFVPGGWCETSFVGLQVTVGIAPIVEQMTTSMVDVPLARRTSHSTAVWYRAEAEKARARDLEKAKRAKPVL